MAKQSLAARIAVALNKRIRANIKVGIIDVVSLTIEPAELYQLLSVERLHTSTMNKVAAALVQQGYEAVYSPRTGFLTVKYDPAPDFLTFLTLEALEESIEDDE